MDLFLTWVVVTVNLFYCWHLPLGDDYEVMCEECSEVVMNFAHSTVDTQLWDSSITKQLDAAYESLKVQMSELTVRESEQRSTDRYRHPMFHLLKLGLRPRGMEDFARATCARSYLTMEQELRDEDRPEWSSREMLERAEFLVRYWQFLTADLRKLSVEYDSDSSRLSREQS